MTNGIPFHGGLFREGFKRLRTVGIVMLVILTLPDLDEALQALSTGYDIPSYKFEEFYLLHPLLVLVPFVPVLLTLWVFEFQNSRRTSDFYHSLPATKFAVSTSCLMASVVWTAIITLGSSLIVLLSAAAYLPDTFSAFDFLLPVCGAFGGAMLSTALTFLALTLTGNTITALAMTVMFLFGPRIFLFYVLRIAVSRAVVLPSDSYDLLFDKYPEGLLYGQYESLVAWVGTILITVVVFTLALWQCRRRKSEVAGRPSVSRGVQIFMRLFFALLCSIPAISIIHAQLVDRYCFERVSYFPVWDSFDIGTLILLYAFVAVAHSLYELVTTRNVKKMVRSFPWLITVALLNVVVIGGMFFVTDSVRSFEPAAEEIDSIRVLDVESRFYGDYTDADARILNEFQQAHLLYRYDRVEVTDAAARYAVSTALTDTLKEYTPDARYEAEISICVNGMEHDRIVYLTESQFQILLNALNAERPFPWSLHLIP